MRSTVAVLLATILAGDMLVADTGSWQNLAALKPAQKIDVVIKTDVVTGEFVRFDDQGITVREKKGERTVAQANVRRVSLAKRSRAVWIGVAAGGAGGGAAGVALGSRLANESGGDFSNLKTAITVACAGIGALIGAVIGSVARRTQTIYRKP